MVYGRRALVNGSLPVQYTYLMKTTPFRSLWLDASRPQRQAWADKIGTSYQYLQKLSAERSKFGKPSIDFALRMRKAILGLDIDPWLPKPLRA